ncbi:MAG: MerR family transcriptional regulator [Desulfovibrio sp.]|nr:MAG: MerR family transcriptional regulator [Desulfovibrio sp.]
MSAKTYRIGEAAKLLKLKTYVLRFWESEFDQLNPRRSEKGQRLYTDVDIELLRRIQHLLHERGLTIDGAKRELAASTPTADTSVLGEVIGELESIRNMLKDSLE